MWRRFTSFDRGARLLMVNQLTINVGFYMLMPYLAGHLSQGLGMAAWTVALVLGMRNLSQQGLFLLGGTLADRLGYKPVIVAGCLLRTAGFALLGLSSSLPALLIASAATGFAGALFNPAVRAHLAHEAGERRVEAFALFNVFYQAGILAGPLIGLAFVTVDFRLVCLAAAGLFALLTVLQAYALPAGRPAAPSAAGVLGEWRSMLADRSFPLFCLAMAGSYVLSFQIYLTLPLEAGGTGAVSLVFAVSAIVAIAGQVRVTDWARSRWSHVGAITRGLTLMALAFLPPALCAVAWPEATGPRLAAVLLCTVVLTLGTTLSYPFEMDTIVSLSGGRLVATHYGLYNTVAGVSIAAGNLLTGALIDSRSRALPWITLSALGAACALAVHALGRRGRLVRPAAEGCMRPPRAGRRGLDGAWAPLRRATSAPGAMRQVPHGAGERVDVIARGEQRRGHPHAMASDRAPTPDGEDPMPVEQPPADRLVVGLGGVVGDAEGGDGAVHAAILRREDPQAGQVPDLMDPAVAQEAQARL
ncbi:MDR family MFS transporter [Sphaerisporangium fuscum]|uniref:MDR family MFS transporter n=1 Tax=Sphaerisporangium fuscum TaxID=2835868 RepID=UPI00202998A3|nr:MFS transporter [Sphaerisporangium fuscum]